MRLGLEEPRATICCRQARSMVSSPAAASWAAHASVCHSHGWMKVGGLQLGGVQELDALPEVVEHGAARHALSAGDGL